MHGIVNDCINAIRDELYYFFPELKPEQKIENSSEDDGYGLWLEIDEKDWPQEWPKDWGSQFKDSLSGTCADTPVWQEFGAKTPQQWQRCLESTNNLICQIETDPDFISDNKRGDYLNRAKAELAYIEGRLDELENGSENKED